jgi:Mg2+-importing ATPase
MATSANFGNMFSMAFSSLMLPFLPFLPKQILLINLLTDIPEFAISSDHVDDSWLISPQQWNFSFIKKFMVIFGLLSSFFDFMTFLILKFLGLSIIEFRTAWFLESILSAACVLLVIRTKHPLTTSLPSLPLTLSVLGVIITTFYIPYSSIGLLFGLCPLQPFLLSFICLIVIFYIAVAEITKKIFYNKLK